MLESTNALIGALAAVVRELDRCQLLVDSGNLEDSAEEAMGPLIDQLHEALADLSEAYEARRAQHPQLLDLPAFRRHFLCKDDDRIIPAGPGGSS